MTDNIKAIIDAKMKKLLDLVLTRDNLQEIGNTAAERVRKRVRLGYGVTQTGGNQKRLKALSVPYKAWRKKNKGKLSPEATAAKSNLTQTGDMLDNIEAEVKGKYVEVQIKGNDNQDKARWVTQQGRPFFFLTKAEQTAVKDLIRKMITKAATRLT